MGSVGRPVLWGILLLAVALSLLSGCPGGGGGPGDLIQQAEEISRRIAPIAEAATAEGTPEALATAAQTIAQEAGVAAATATAISLTVEYDQGGTEVWVVDPVPSEPAQAQASTLRARAPAVREPVGDTQAIVLDAIAEDPAFSDASSQMDAVANTLTGAGFVVDRADGSAADVDSFKCLSPYGVIAALQHGAAITYRGEPGVVLQTGQEGDWDDVRASYASDWREGRVSLVHVEWGTENRESTLRTFLAVTDRLFSHYYAGSGVWFPHSLVYNGGCQTLMNDSLADALYRSGAAAYVGWTETQSQSPWVGARLFSEMADGTSLSDALAALPESLRHQTRWGDAWLRYYPQGGGTIQLSGGAGQVGWIHVFSTPSGAAIWLDGADTGEVAPATISASPGTHTVMLRLSGYQDWSATVNVVADQASTVNAALQPTAGAEGRIAFVGTSSGDPDIYAMNADGTGATRLTTDPLGGFAPAWSPAP